MIVDQTDLNATCAFLATYLHGQPAWLLQEGSRPREFSVIELSPHQRCVWDEQRCSYVHLQDANDHWVSYDIASGQWLEVTRAGQSFVFTQSARGAWFERADIDPSEVHLSGSDGEHCYAITNVREIPRSAQRPALAVPLRQPSHREYASRPPRAGKLVNVSRQMNVSC